LAGDDGKRGRERGRPRPSAYQRAAGLLVRREHSRRELKRKLTARGVAAEEAEAAVERLAGQGWQDDDRFAESLARSRAAAGYGPLRIRAELAAHGLAGEQIEAALAACEADWSENARHAIARRYRAAELSDPARRRKAAEFLFRRGFDHDSVYAAIRFDCDTEL
jgi:regulatory protein